MDLSRFPRRRYTPGPTPLEFLPHFTKALRATCPEGAGPDVWIKRDDMLGLTPGGNKTRKLEFLAADALSMGADTLITCGAPQSNHCRITLAAATKEKLKCRLVIEERIPGSYRVDASGNNFLYRLLGVEDMTVVPAGTDLLAAMQQVAHELDKLGRRGYVIPSGGSNAIGGLGYVACAQELQQQFFEQGVQIDEIVLGSSSAGTHGGLLAGFIGNNVHIPLIGIAASQDAAGQDALVLRQAQSVLDLLGIDVKVPPESVLTFDDWWRPGYAVPNRAMVEAVQMLARTEAIVLDPVYTGKAMAGLIGLSRQGYFSRDEKVLFMHTGGAPALQVYEAEVLGLKDLPA